MLSKIQPCVFSLAGSSLVAEVVRLLQVSDQLLPIQGAREVLCVVDLVQCHAIRHKLPLELGQAGLQSFERQLRHVQLGNKIGCRPRAPVDVRPGFDEPALVLLFDALDCLRYPCARIGRDSVGNGHVDPLVLLWGPDRPGKERDLGHRASRRSVRPCCAGNTPSNPDYILLLQAAVDIDVVDEWWETGKRGQVCAPSVAPKVWGVRDVRNQIALEGVLLQNVERNGLFGA